MPESKDDFYTILTNSYPNANKNYIKRYINFCYLFLNVGEKLQGHHLLPKSRFNEYEKVKSNIFHLSIRAHFIAHVLFTKATGDLFESVMFMCRFNKELLFKSRLYEIAYNSGIGRIQGRFKGKNNPMYGKGYKLLGKKNGRHADNFTGDMASLGKKISEKNKGYVNVVRDGICLRIRVEDRLPTDGTPYDGKIKVRDSDGSLKIFDNKEDFYNSGLNFHTKGKTLVYSKATLEKMYIASDEYKANKHLYYHMNSKELKIKLAEVV